MLCSISWKETFARFDWLPWTMAVSISILCIVAAKKLIPWKVLVDALKAPDTLSRRVWVWVIATFLCFAVTNAIFVLAHSVAPQKAPNAAMVFSVFWAIAVAVLILLLIFSLAVVPEYGVLVSIAGGVLGWLLGMYLSPEGTSEQQQFAKIGTAVVALFSGYTLKIVVDWLSTSGKQYRIYCGLFFLCAAVSTAAVYNTRAYGNKEVKITFDERFADPKDKQKASVTLSTNSSVEIHFNAEVRGVPDTSIEWEILSKADSTNKSDAATVSKGNFIAKVADTYRVQARSNYDPKLLDVIEVEVKNK